MMAGRRFAVWASLLALSCGGGAASGPGAETGGSNHEGGSSESDKKEEPAGEKPAEPAPGEEPAKESGGKSESEVTTLEGEELASVLQSVLSDPQLLEGLHLNKPGRAPLKVFGPNLPTKLKVIVGSHEVKVVAEPKSKNDAVFVFTKIERSGDQVRLHYRFEIEGLEGRATVVNKSGKWELSANRVVEK